MKRRERVDDSVGPARLRRYDPAEWGDDPVAFWDAREVWQAAHPQLDLPLDGAGPDVPWDPDAV